jgi:transposase-like protein
VKSLSANTVVRLKERWSQEYDAWCKRDLAGKHYVYFWADGIHVNVRLEGEADRHQCILVIIGATADGRKELVALADGYRESEASWAAVLTDLKRRGLTIAPKLAVGDGALGFWAALRKTMPSTKEQRCWVHKTANILNKLPKCLQEKAKRDVHEIWMSPTKERAGKAFDTFLETYGAKYPKAAECLRQDRDELLAFYDFPAEHWAHVRTTNPIESTFATIRLRHRRTKGSGSRRTSLAMMFALTRSAEKKWRRLKGAEKLEFVTQGRIFQDGELQQDAA